MVRVNGMIVANLNAGDQYDARAGSPQQIPANAQITANRPILVGEFSNGRSYDQVAIGCNELFATNCNDDPFFALVPPTEHYLTSYTVPTFSMQYFTNLIDLIVPTSAINSMKIDGAAVSPADFTAIGTSGFSSAMEGVSNANFHTITGDGVAKFGAISYGFFGADAYGFPAGQGLVASTSPPQIAAVALTPPTETTVGLSEKCVTATVTDSASAAAPDVRVDFTVTGANTAAGSRVTGAAGQTPPFCYTPAAFGADTITGAVGTTSGTATKTWTDPNASGGTTGGGGTPGGGTTGGGTAGGGTTGGPAPAPATTTTQATSQPTPQTAAKVAAAAAKEALSGLPSTKKCVSRRHFTIRLRQSKRLKVDAAVVRLQNRTVATRKGKRLTAPVDLRGYPKGKFVVRITLLFHDGRTNSSKRTYRTCVPRRRPATSQVPIPLA